MEWRGKTRDFVKLVKSNGYEHVRTNGSHMIFRNNEGRIIPVNIRLNKMVAKRLIEEYKLA